MKIADVLPDTPAQAAGLLPGDLILSIDGEDVADVRGYAGILGRYDPGDTIRIRVSPRRRPARGRGDARRALSSVIARRPRPRWSDRCNAPRLGRPARV